MVDSGQILVDPRPFWEFRAPCGGGAQNAEMIGGFPKENQCFGPCDPFFAAPAEIFRPCGAFCKYVFQRKITVFGCEIHFFGPCGAFCRYIVFFYVLTQTGSFLGGKNFLKIKKKDILPPTPSLPSLLPAFLPSRESTTLLFLPEMIL